MSKEISYCTSAFNVTIKLSYLNLSYNVVCTTIPSLNLLFYFFVGGSYFTSGTKLFVHAEDFRGLFNSMQKESRRLKKMNTATWQKKVTSFKRIRCCQCVCDSTMRDGAAFLHTDTLTKWLLLHRIKVFNHLDMVQNQNGHQNTHNIHTTFNRFQVLEETMEGEFETPHNGELHGTCSAGWDLWSFFK